MYLTNKYTRWYYNIIQRAQTREISGYTERHHIIPKSLGGNDLISNLVRLTAREHFICHLLLVKMTKGDDKSKMALAVLMLTTTSKNQQRYKISNRQYQILKENANNARRGKPSPLRGTKVVDETKLTNIRTAIALREERYLSGELNRGNLGKYIRDTEYLRKSLETRPQFTTKGYKHTDETLKLISNKRKGQSAHNKGMPPVKVCCLNCKTIIDIRNFSRYHGNNCKSCFLTSGHDSFG